MGNFSELRGWGLVFLFSPHCCGVTMVVLVEVGGVGGVFPDNHLEGPRDVPLNKPTLPQGVWECPFPLSVFFFRAPPKDSLIPLLKILPNLLRSTG